MKDILIASLLIRSVGLLLNSDYYAFEEYPSRRISWKVEDGKRHQKDASPTRVYVKCLMRLTNTHTHTHAGKKGNGKRHTHTDKETGASAFWAKYVCVCVFFRAPFSYIIENP